MVKCERCGRDIQEGRQLCDICMIELQTRPRININVPMIIALLGCIVFGVGLFLPFVTTYRSITAMDLSQGVLLLVLDILVALFAAFRLGATSLVFSVITLGGIYFTCNNISSIFTPRLSYGAIMMIVSMIVVCFASLFIKRNKKNK